MSKTTRRKEKEEAAKAAPKVEVKTEPKAEVKTEPKVEVKTEPKVEVKAEPKTEVKAEPKAKAEKMTVAKLTEICRTLAEATKECKETDRDHEDRICKLEKTDRDHEDRICKLEKAVFGVKPEPVPEPKSGPEPEPKSEPAPEPAKTENTEAKPISGACYRNGVGYAFKFWQAATRTWGLTSDVWAAKQISNGVYDPIWVWYENGQIDHILSDDEIIKFVP